MAELEPIIWMRPEKPARGPAPTYSRERIAAVAIEIADSEGIDAVSMRRIAKELGTGAMTLYRYLPAKEDLYAVMIDHAVGFEPQEPTGDVRADLATLARRHRQILCRHPWLAPLLAGRPIIGPNVLRGTERDLALLGGCGLSIDEMLDVLNPIRHWVNGAVQAELAERAAADQSGVDRLAWQQRMGPYLTTLLATGEFPHLSQMIEESEFGDADERFENGLAILLAGVETRLPAIAGSTRPPSAA
ncbi:TetR/AcrR family transcriptional regulator [Micromonospora rhizosphaerae]|uniref:TetR/AcrR family transcriptional regulator n=1 Tax=Micromonospora rhizosphaerae TaxID=568872 RepID=UPI001C407851|nr:TetR/AcrR family transcriptional regulator [Micromonospora rhizosphaerae]